MMRLTLFPLCALVGLVNAEVCLIYGTVTTQTAKIAQYIVANTGLTAMDIADLKDHNDIQHCEAFIVGTPTWDTGAEDRRTQTEWDNYLYEHLPKLDLSGKKVAVFGLGDSDAYPSEYCEAMDELATTFRARGGELIGAWPTDGYNVVASKSIWPSLGNKWVGLAIDQTNQEDLSEKRVKDWVAQIKSEGMPISCGAQGAARRHLTHTASHTQAETEEAWYSQWTDDLRCWFAGLPIPMQSSVGACAGAFGLHMAGRLEAFLGKAGRAAPTMQGAGAKETGCEWIEQGAHQLSLPEFPDFGSNVRFTLPPIPRLLGPIPSFGRLQSKLKAKEQLAMRKQETTTSLNYVGLGAGAAGGAAAAVVFMAFSLSRGRFGARAEVKRTAAQSVESMSN